MVELLAINLLTGVVVPHEVGQVLVVDRKVVTPTVIADRSLEGDVIGVRVEGATHEARLREVEARRLDIHP